MYSTAQMWPLLISIHLTVTDLHIQMISLLSVTPAHSRPYFKGKKKSLCKIKHSVVLETTERDLKYHRSSKIHPGVSAYGAESQRMEQHHRDLVVEPESAIHAGAESVHLPGTTKADQFDLVFLR